MDLAHAIGQAAQILNWQEQLTTDDQPPQWMWTHQKELEIHFEDLDQRREARFSGGSDDTEAPMMDNVLVNRRR